MRFGGEILKESLEDRGILSRLQVTRVEHWVPREPAPFQPPGWTAIYFTGEQEEAGGVAQALSQAMKERWYGNITTASDCYVIFRGRVFQYPRGDAAGRARAQEYARAQGIPERQLDWGEEEIDPSPEESAGLVVLILGSPGDQLVAEQVGEALGDWEIPVAMRVASAHKSPQHLLELLEDYELDPRPKVYITIAGRSNALSGMVDAHVSAPVIACPPYSERFAGGDLLSSLRVPSGVASAVVLEPEAAALLAVKILAMVSPALREEVRQGQQLHRQRLLRADLKLLE